MDTNNSLTLIGGGRYNKLVNELGGPHMCGIGWAAGIERLQMASNFVAETSRPTIVICMDDKSRHFALKVTDKLRNEFDSVFVVYMSKLGKLGKLISRYNPKFLAFVGEEEIQDNSYVLKEMDSERQDRIKII